MKKWSKRKLGDLVDFVGGGTPRRDVAGYWGGDIPWASVKDLGSQSLAATAEFITAEGLEHSASNLIPEGTVIIASRVGLGKVAINRLSVAINQDLKALTPRDSSLSPRYLLYFLLSKASQLENAGVGATVKGLTLADYQKLELLLPPNTEQERIVRLLDEADALQKLRAQADRRMADFIPALFHEMFGDPITNPKGWPVATLGEVTHVRSGTGFPLNEQGHRDQEIPFFKVSDMNTPGNDIGMYRSRHTISSECRKKLGAPLMPAGSVVFPKVGAAIATNKKRLLMIPSCVDNNIMAVWPVGELSPRYMLGLFSRKNLSEFASNATPPSIRKGTVEDWKIPLPTVVEQQRYERLAGLSAELQVAQADSRARSDALFQSMLHRAFEGEL